MNQNPSVLTRAALFFYAVLFAIALIGSKLLDQMDLWWSLTTPPWPLQVAVGVAVGMAGVWLSRIIERRFVGVRQLAADFSDLLRGLTRGQAWALALASGIGEEALFRGMLQPLVGLIPTAILFGIIHIGPARRYLWWTASALLYGVVLGLLFEWGQGLIAPIVAHVVLNGVNLYQLGTRPAIPRPWAQEEAGSS